ncbi:endonuclease/exonuclease/phosphatase family protein [Aquitalea denitrificans]|uniref:endonuclease/exonuclease/phosphatase family protein n=1 Tax=Aquitalea denitrificans TaxID=519081 RepID=UPI0013593E27|nr:endonuclease/exonuclease/phosphatase family protein [Aquitalea denitrificans]
MEKATEDISIFWWNVYDFYHFDNSTRNQNNGQRWPASDKEYQLKCNAIDNALRAFITEHGKPTIIALGEITAKSASDLKDRLFPEYNLISLDVKPGAPSLQLAILHKKTIQGVELTEAPPIVVPYTHKSTRPMAVLNISSNNSIIQCIVCHWPAKFEDGSEKCRERIADYLSQYVYDFLNTDSLKNKKKKSTILIGDFNQEPFEKSVWSDLNTHRHRARAFDKHWTDKDIKRVHLYNCSWRLLGELSPLLPSGNMKNAAGTYYWKKKKSWHNLDHVIVSQGLLGTTPPFIDESSLTIIALPEFIPSGVPEKFSITQDGHSGLSDHLPLFATIKMELH